MKRRVLWIEDEAFVAAQVFTGPVLAADDLDLTIAYSASHAEEVLLADGTEYDAVVVDIRLHPGRKPHWLDRFRERRQDVAFARLGLLLLYALLLPGQAPEEQNPVVLEVPAWVSPARFGVLSVETKEDLAMHLQRLLIPESHMVEKTRNTKDTALIDLIRRILV